MWYAITSTVCLFSGCNNFIWIFDENFYMILVPLGGIQQLRGPVWPNFDHLPPSSGQLWTVYILHKEILARVVCHFQNKRPPVRLCVGTKKFELLWKSTQFQVTCSFCWKSKDVLLCLKVFFQKVLMHLLFPQSYEPSTVCWLAQP